MLLKISYILTDKYIFRYTDVNSIKFLERCSALDPRFKELAWLSPEGIEAVYTRLIQSIAKELDAKENSTKTSETSPEAASTEWGIVSDASAVDDRDSSITADAAALNKYDI